MNPFSTLEDVQDAYHRYVRTFQQFRNPDIRDWVRRRIDQGTLLWRDPHVQLMRRFQQGSAFNELVNDDLIHPETPKCFTVEAGDRTAEPLHPYKHQSEAVRHIQSGHNTIVATGTGSGKSFTFGIPIVSECLRLHQQGIDGIKAVIIYPMNALANSQYDDFARRLAGSGLRLALYTGDTFTNPQEALQAFREVTGRDEPFDSEVISRQDIRQNPPDILMTNYVMLELLLTRFEDRILFPQEHEGVLQFLVLDEVHTYTGNRGSDVACLVRRLKQHTGTTGSLRCIATSATVQSGEGEDAEQLIADFAGKLFGEPFSRDHVVGESYIPTFGDGDDYFPDTVQVSEGDIDAYDGSTEKVVDLTEALLGRTLQPEEHSGEALGGALSRQATLYFLEEELGEGARSLPEMVNDYREQYRPKASEEEALRELTAALLVGTAPMMKRGDSDQVEPRLIPKLHAFFSQGRGITSCLTTEGPHLNDRGERTCPTCASDHDRERDAHPLNFCRSCGQEYYGVSIQDDGTLVPRELDDDEGAGEPAYLYPGHHDFDAVPLPDTWLTKAGNVKSKYRSANPQNTIYCPECNQVDAACGHAGKLKVALIRVPFLLCSSCGIKHTRRPREFNKLFTFGKVGRSTATDVLVSNTLTSAPPDERKVIAFSDNRQDTALQAAHLNNLQKRLHFRRSAYHALENVGRPLNVGDMGLEIFDAMERTGTLPQYAKATGRFRGGRGGEQQYQRYLGMAMLLDLQRTSRRIHQNLEDVGLLQVQYEGLDALAAADDVWDDVPVLNEIDEDTRHDYLYGFLDIMRKRLALHHPDLLHFQNFKVRVMDKLNQDVLVEEKDYHRPAGFSDEADTKSKRFNVYRFVHPSTSIVAWTRRALNVDYGDTKELIPKLVDTLASPDVSYLTREHFRWTGDVYMLPHDLIELSVSQETEHQVCPQCGSVHHFRSLRVCTETRCDTIGENVDLSQNYFRKEYTRHLDEVVRVRAEEHSGQVPGQERRQIEESFRDPKSDLNAIVCTPTMELGIDIGDLSNVYMRNVPPSPSNYAQRSGRAGRKGQASLITVFCGAGSYRGPHDQYFYRNPEKIIAGKISPPRFLLDNERLIRTHIHALVLEMLAHRAEFKLPSKPREMINIESEGGFPFFKNFRGGLRSGMKAHADDMRGAVHQAFESEMRAFDWFDGAFVKDTIARFVSRLDRAYDGWREEYVALEEEREEINRVLGRQKTESNLRRRRNVIEDRLGSMREGRGDFYTYRFLGSQGFLPNYAFPRDAISVTFYDRDAKLSRDPVIALNEYAPGNFIYYRGSRYEVLYGRPRTRGDEMLAFEKLLICPECETAYLGEENAKRARCAYCEASLRSVHPIERALQMPDMVAQQRASITADEEERMRKGYEIETHYQATTRAKRFQVNREEESAFEITYEHNGRVLIVNRGPRKAKEDDASMGFAYCQACNRWLVSENAVENHTGDDGKCSQNANADQVLLGIHLFTRTKNDVVTIDCPLPEGVGDVDGFYITLLNTLEQALGVSMELDEREVSGFVSDVPEDPDRKRLVMYETAEGGTGAVQSLTDPHRLKAILKSARELLHEGEDGCEKACYECLRTFYNQRDHELLDRMLVLPFLQSLEDLSVEGVQVQDEEVFTQLHEQCQSGFEREVLRAIRDSELPLPDEAQRTVYEGDEPVAEADFFYEPRMLVFVDGSPHYKDYIKHADREKRLRLKRMGVPHDCCGKCQRRD